MKRSEFNYRLDNAGEALLYATKVRDWADALFCARNQGLIENDPTVEAESHPIVRCIYIISRFPNHTFFQKQALLEEAWEYYNERQKQITTNMSDRDEPGLIARSQMNTGRT
ncbi:MAG: hypothetical protein WAX80_03245 [Minisyncoccia bacterium]